MSITIKETIDDFIKTELRYGQIDKDMVRNLFGIGKKSPSSYSLATQDCFSLDFEISDDGICDVLKYSIRASIKSYTKNKDNAILIYKKYLKFLNKKYKLNVDIFLPPIPVSISLERQMYIAKLLHDTNIKISDLPELLLVSERTIEEDLRKLRGQDDDPLQVMGQKLSIDFERSRSGLKFPSTVHPLFLTQNLTQIIAILRGLEHQAKHPAYERYAVNTAASIWLQLSNYAKNRILTVSEILDIDINWFQRINKLALDELSFKLFSNEVSCSNNLGSGCVLDCLKNGKLCYIEYQTENGNIIYYQGCKIKNIYRESLDIDCVAIEVSTETYNLEISKILRSAFTPEELV